MYIVVLVIGNFHFRQQSTGVRSGALINPKVYFYMMSRSAIRKQRSGKSAPLPFDRVTADKEINNIASSVVVNKVR